MDYKSDEYINKLLKRINAEAGALIAKNVEEIERKYGTVSPTVEQILSKLYEKSAGPLEKALAIKLLLVDVYHWHNLPLPLLTYNIGVLRALMVGAPEEEQMTLEALLEGLEHLSETDEHLIRKRLGEKAIKKRWAPRDEALEKAKAKARKRWLELKQIGKKKIRHNKMADILLDEMPELARAGVTRSMLIKALKSVAKEIDPT